MRTDHSTGPTYEFTLLGRISPHVLEEVTDPVVVHHDGETRLVCVLRDQAHFLSLVDRLIQSGSLVLAVRRVPD